MDRSEYIESILQDLSVLPADSESDHLVRMRFEQEQLQILDAMVVSLNEISEREVSQSDLINVAVRRLIEKLGAAPTSSLVQVIRDLSTSK